MGPARLNDPILDLFLGCHVSHLHLETGEAAMPDMDEQNRNNRVHP
jgi:hypothetical protein